MQKLDEWECGQLVLRRKGVQLLRWLHDLSTLVLLGSLDDLAAFLIPYQTKLKMCAASPSCPTSHAGHCRTGCHRWAEGRRSVGLSRSHVQQMHIVVMLAVGSSIDALRAYKIHVEGYALCSNR
jgi:hypothetical protein